MTNQNEEAGPVLTPDKVLEDKELALAVLENFIFTSSMNDGMDNSVLCALAAMKVSAQALKEDINDSKNS